MWHVLKHNSVSFSIGLYFIILLYFYSAFSLLKLIKCDGLFQQQPCVFSDAFFWITYATFFRLFVARLLQVSTSGRKKSNLSIERRCFSILAKLLTVHAPSVSMQSPFRFAIPAIILGTAERNGSCIYRICRVCSKK